MTARQAINLLNNKIMPCILYSSTTSINNEATRGAINNYSEHIIDYICKYSLYSSYDRDSSYSSYQFITLQGNYLYANNLNDEISTNNHSGGGAIKK